MDGVYYALCPWDRQHFSAACYTVDHSTARTKRPTGQNKWLDAVIKFWLIPAWSSHRSFRIFFYAPLSSFYPLMTSDHFDLSAMYGSAVEICFAVGMMVSSLLFSSVLKVERKIQVSFIGLFGMGIASFICGAIPPVHIGWFFFAASCVCLGAAGNVHTIPLTAYIQETVAPEKIGVNVCFFISGLCMIVLTTLVLIQYAAKRRRKER